MDFIFLVFSGLCDLHGTTCLKLSHTLDQRRELFEDRIKKLLLLVILVIFTFVSFSTPSIPAAAPGSSTSPPASPFSLELFHLEEQNLALSFFPPPIPKETDLPTYGPSNTVVGEQMSLILTLADDIFGGSSRHRALLDFSPDLLPHALGFPGASSHSNGTETAACNGGVNIPSSSFFFTGIE